MSSNKRFALTIACFMGLAFIWGALFQAQYIAKCQTNLSSFTVREKEAVTHTKEVYYFPQYPANGTFWEVGIDQGFFPDSEEAHNY